VSLRNYRFWRSLLLPKFDATVNRLLSRSRGWTLAAPSLQAQRCCPHSDGGRLGRAGPWYQRRGTSAMVPAPWYQWPETEEEKGKEVCCELMQTAADVGFETAPLHIHGFTSPVSSQ